MKFLIVKTSAFGDILHVFPVVAYLRQKCPYAQIDWVVEKSFSELVYAHPEIERTVVLESKKWRCQPWRYRKEIRAFKQELKKVTYDVVFDLQGNIKSGLIVATSRARAKVGFSWSCLPERPSGLFTNVKFSIAPGKNIREDYLSLVQQYFNDKASFTAPSFLFKLQEELDFPESDKKRILVCPGAAWGNKRLPLSTLASILEKWRGSFILHG
ncbi:MAG: glycosyltransferase family 9 protein, partial [Chlamydiales bacterium]